MRIISEKVRSNPLFETVKLMALDGKGLINLTHQDVDYKFLSEHQDYIAGVILPVTEFTDNHSLMTSFQLECCKGVTVELAGDSKATYSTVASLLDHKDHLIDFVYLPLAPTNEGDQEAKEVADLAGLFQAASKLVVIGVKTQNDKDLRSIQKILSDLTYHISRNNLFLDGIIIEVPLVEAQKEEQTALVNFIIIKRCLPSGMKKVAIRAKQSTDRKILFEITKLKIIKGWNVMFSLEGTNNNPFDWAMASAGVLS